MPSINLSTVIGEFVNNYHTLIKPTLESGDLEEASIAISDSVYRFKFAEQDISFVSAKLGSYARYLTILVHLAGLAKLAEANLQKRTIDRQLMRIDRTVNELELIMRGDKDYEEQAQTERAHQSERGTKGKLMHKKPEVS